MKNTLLKNSPVFLPDIGTFFNQDVSEAISIVDLLIDSGVKIVKGEILHSAEICIKNSGNVSYAGLKPRKLLEGNYRDIIEKKVVTFSSYEKIFEHCKNRGAEFVVSVYDIEGAKFAKDIGAIALKISSSNIVHQPLIEYCSCLSLPLLIDTGRSTMEEAARAVNWAKDAGACDIVIEHSPMAPPNPVSKHNLSYMQTLGKALSVPYGLSDHHVGEEMLYAAVALGAVILEKGVCHDNKGDDLDRVHALPVSKISEVIQKIENISHAIGNGIHYLPRVRDYSMDRMGLVAKRNLKPGDLISLETTTFAFPAKGIAVEHWGIVNGWNVTASVEKGCEIGWSNVQDMAT